MTRKVQGAVWLGLAFAAGLAAGLAAAGWSPAEAARVTQAAPAEVTAGAPALRRPAKLDIARNLQSLHMASRLQALSRTMTIRSLLAALSIDKEANIAALTLESLQFDRIIKGLRHGDAELGLAKAENAEILKKLARLEKEWSIFGPVVRKIVESGEVSKRGVALVAECIIPLAEGTRELIEVVQYYATGGRTFSLRTSMIGTTEAQQALVNEMAAGYLLIAYGHKPKAYRAKLQDQVLRFDRTLRGLLAGDSELQLLPAPTSDLRQSFRAAVTLWEAHRPAMRGVAGGREVPREAIPDFMLRNEALAREVGRAVELYKSI